MSLSSVVSKDLETRGCGDSRVRPQSNLPVKAISRSREISALTPSSGGEVWVLELLRQPYYIRVVARLPSRSTSRRVAPMRYSSLIATTRSQSPRSLREVADAVELMAEGGLPVCRRRASSFGKSKRGNSGQPGHNNLDVRALNTNAPNSLGGPITEHLAREGKLRVCGRRMGGPTASSAEALTPGYGLVRCDDVGSAISQRGFSPAVCFKAAPGGSSEPKTPPRLDRYSVGGPTDPAPAAGGNTAMDRFV